MNHVNTEDWKTGGPAEDASVKGLVKRATYCSLIVVILFAAASEAAVMAQHTTTNVTASRKVSLDIKIVFIGFNRSNIDTEYLAWRENLPSQKVNKIMIGEREASVTYDLRYEFVFLERSFKQKLLDFLRGISVEKELENPWFNAETHNVLYDANKVEEWFYKNRADYSGFPGNGYTFLIANLTELPSVSYDQLAQPWKNLAISPHYYSVEYVDEDLGYRIRNRQFMTAWGGHYRMWFFDVSAGPSFNTPKDPPLQVVLTALKIDLNTQYGRIWLTQYLADYLWEAVWNFAVPQFVHEPIYSKRYRFTINVFDNRTDLERTSVPVDKTLNASRIKSSFKELLPYSEIEVSIKMQNYSSDPNLARVIKESFKMIDVGTGYVDVRPVYRYLQLNIGKYVPRILRNEEEVTIPVFCFVFSKQHIAYTSKWEVRGSKASLQGIALDDMAIISLTQYYELERGAIVKPPQGTKGIGFSQTVIHESGHMLGLMHPFQFGQVGDFVDSPMSYFAHSYDFSQFDKDALRRMHADRILLESSAKLAEADESAMRKIAMPLSLAKLNNGRDLVRRAEQEYERMNYVEAVSLAFESRRLAAEGLRELREMPNVWPLAAICGVIIGVVVGYYLSDIWRKTRRPRSLPPSSTQLD